MTHAAAPAPHESPQGLASPSTQPRSFETQLFPVPKAAFPVTRAGTPGQGSGPSLHSPLLTIKVGGGEDAPSSIPCGK